MPRQYPRDFRDRAARLVVESKGNDETEWSAIQVVAARLGVGGETLRKWMRKSEGQAGIRPGVTDSSGAEIRKLKKEVAEIRRANEILRTTLAFSKRGKIGYVDAYRDRFGVERICRVRSASCQDARESCAGSSGFARVMLAVTALVLSFARVIMS